MVRRNVAEQQQHSHSHSQSSSNSNGNGNNNNNNNGQRSGDSNNNAGGCPPKTMSTTSHRSTTAMSSSSSTTTAAAAATLPAAQQQQQQQQQQHCQPQQHSPSDGGVSSSCSLPSSPPLLRQTATPPQGAQIVPPVCALHHPQQQQQQQLALLAAMQHHHHILQHHMPHQPAPAAATAPTAHQHQQHQQQHQHQQHQHENGHGGMSPNGGSGGSSASSVSSVSSCNGGSGAGQANNASNGTNGIGPPLPSAAMPPPAPLYIQYPGDFFPSEYYIAPHPHEGICPQHPHHPHAQQHHHQPMCAISAEYGPAAVQMVSHNRPPPTMALPVQVPPYVNENGTLTHVVLPPQQYQQLHHGQGHLHAAPFISGNGTSHYYTPMPGYPPGPGPAGNGPPHYHMPPVPGAGAPLPQQQQPTGAAASSATSQPHLHSPHSPSPPNYRDERMIQQHTKLLRKLEKQRNDLFKYPDSTMSTPTHSPSPRRNDTNGHQQQQHYNGLRPQQQQQQQQQQPVQARQLVTSHAVEDGAVDEEQKEDEEEDEEDQSATIVEQISSIEKPEVIDVSSRAAKIFWEPPSITDVIEVQDLRYQVLLSDSGKQCKYKSLYRGEAYECIVQDLLPGQEYLVRLQVQYKQFQGGVSEPTEFKTPACEPDQPLPPKLQSRTKSSINLRWTAPACNGSPIQHYLLEYDEGRGNALQFVELAKIKAKHYVLTKLQPTTVYSFRLAAVNQVGQSIYSEVSSYSTAGNPPTAPKAPQLQACSPSSLQLVWERRSQDGDFLLQLQDAEFGHGYLNSYKGGETHYECLQLRRATSYQFRLRAENDAGVSPWSPEVSYSTAPERPGRPGKPHAKGKIHGTHFKARWEMPTDTGGGEILHYHMELSAGGPQFERIYSGADAEAKCEGLQPGTTYQLRVCCEGPAGVSPFSEIGHVTTEAVPPSAPTPYSDKPPSPYAAVIRLHQPDNNGGAPVKEYEAQLRQVTADRELPSQIIYRETANYFVAEQLLPGCSYEVQARAINRVGAGNWSQWFRFTTAVAPPAAPEALQALVKSATQLCVTWRTPTLNNGAAVTGYTLQSVSQSLEEPEEEPLGMCFSNCYQGAQSNVELRQLTPYTRYYLRVLASNVAGTGCPSDVVCVATHAAVPGAPQMQGYEFTAQEVTLNWTQPAAHGSPICSYNIEYGEKTIATPDACTRYTIGQLTPETSYKFRVQAVNAIGAGTFSAYAKLTTQPAPPAPPRLECSGVGHNFIKLKWSSSSSNGATAGTGGGAGGGGGDFTKYFVEMYVSRAKQFQNIYSGTNCMCKVNKLQERSSYTFRIYAHTDRAGDGDYSEEYVFQTTATLPASIKAPRVLHVANLMQPLEQLTLEWQHSKNTFYDRVEYELQYAVIAASGAGDLNPPELSESRSSSNSRNNVAASAAASAVAPLSLSNQEYLQLYRGLDTKFTIDNLLAGSSYQFRVYPVRVTSSGELIYGQASTALRYQVPKKLAGQATGNGIIAAVAPATAAAATAAAPSQQRFSRSKLTAGAVNPPRSISASAISGNGSGVGVDLHAIGRLQHEISASGFNACADPLHHHHHHHHHHQQQPSSSCLAAAELSTTNSSSSASTLLLRGKSSDVQQQHHMHHQHHLHHSHHVHHAHYSHLLMGRGGAAATATGGSIAAAGGKVASSSCLQHGGGLVKRAFSRLTTLYSNRKRLTDQQKAVCIVVSFVFVTFLVAMLVNMLRG